MRTTSVRITAIAAALGLTLAACGGGGGGESSTATAEAATPDTAATEAPGAEAPAADPSASQGSVTDLPGKFAFEAPQLGGGTLSSASFAGRSTVLWFWAPWCTICRAEASDVAAAAAAFEGEVEVIGVAGRGDVADMEGFVDATDTGSFPHVVDETGSIWSDYGVAAQPAFAFIGEDGSVDVFVGTLGEAGLTEKMRGLAAS
jgi:thiol-disulfide isomerase/thioredoxin